MNQVIAFMKELLEDMEDTHWSIAGMKNFKEVTKGGVVYARLEDGSVYEKQDNIYICQTTGYLGDNYSGTVIKPISDSVALIIKYSC